MSGRARTTVHRDTHERRLCIDARILVFKLFTESYIIQRCEDEKSQALVIQT